MSKSKPTGSDRIGSFEQSLERDGVQGNQPSPLSTFSDPSPVRLTLRKNEAAQALGVSERTLHGWLKAGVIPSFKIGRIVQVPVEGLRAFIAHQTQNGGQA